jgi:hypothetical protein
MNPTSFLRGFAEATEMSQQESSEQWAGFSRMLSDRQIRRIESGGYASGLREGKRFRKLYPEEAQNPGLRAQVRRLPSGEIQLKIPLKSQNPASLKAAMQAVRKLGRRVKSVVMVTGNNGGRLHNPRKLFSGFSFKQLKPDRESGREVGNAFVDEYRPEERWVQDVVAPDGTLLTIVYTHSVYRKGDPQDWPWDAKHVSHVEERD